jgi:hypothetical protein
MTWRALSVVMMVAPSAMKAEPADVIAVKVRRHHVADRLAGSNAVNLREHLGRALRVDRRFDHHDVIVQHDE